VTAAPAAEPWPGDDPAGPAEDEQPHDVRAEKKVLSALLDGALFGKSRALDAIEICAERVGLLPSHFYRPAHQVLYDAIITMAHGGERITVETVRDWVAVNGGARAAGGPAHTGMYLLELAGLHEPATMVGPLARIVLDRAARRRWLEASTRIAQHARSHGTDAAVMAAACLGEADAAAAEASDVAPRAMRVQAAGLFVASAGSRPVPVIPGVVNRMDRVIVVGRPGSGKTILGLQHGVAAACGVRPFGGARYDPQRVLWIDLELPDYLAAAGLKFVLGRAEHYGDPGDRFQVLHRPRGLNLAVKANAALLAGLIRKAAPDLVIAGPVYKMHADTGERGDHTQVMDFWDDLRDQLGFALWLETHPAKDRFGNFSKHPTPSGSSRWGDWPEVGFGMVPGKGEHLWDVVPFRGMRDRSRAWPESLTVNISGSGWPWQATYPQGTFETAAA
jgi:AAA domain-containing protein/DnaB helicase-like protein